MKLNICITLKKGVLDPQGGAVKEALTTLGFTEVEDVRVGKFLELTVEEASKEKALERAKKMCEKILANTVVEDFRIEAP